MKCVLLADGAPESSARDSALFDLARLCSPRVESLAPNAVVFDANGLSRVLGTPRDIAREVQRLAIERGVRARIAIAPTTTAAWLVAQAPHAPMMHANAAPITVIEGTARVVADALAPLPVALLLTVPGLAELAGDIRRRRVPRGPNFRAAPSPMRTSNTGFVKVEAQLLSTFERWGVRTLADVAALSRADMRARFGDVGARLHEASVGEDRLPLTPGAEPRRFVERLHLDWPIEGLEPLSFVTARLCESLSKQLEQADRGAVAITTRLALVSKAGFERTLHLPAPMRDARVLRTLIQLDLEAHPPQGVTDEVTGLATSGIDAVEVEVEVSPGRITQGALFVRSLPTPETMATLIARLGALMGETRVGSPHLLDLDDEREVAMRPFVVRAADAAVNNAAAAPVATTTPLAIRRMRRPAAIRMPLANGRPHCPVAAGPWRSSGRWWRRDDTAWDRDTWDVQSASGALQRVSFNRRSKNWELEGTYD